MDELESFEPYQHFALIVRLLLVEVFLDEINNDRKQER